MNTQNKKGFSAIELLVVIGLLVTLMTIHLSMAMESKEKILEEFEEIMSQYQEILDEIDNEINKTYEEVEE